MTQAASPRPIVRRPLRRRYGMNWRVGMTAALIGVAILLFALAQSSLRGVGVWGNNIPFVWGFDLTNYVWWIGIANGGGLLASGLVLRRHDLRTSINRFAEALCLAATTCAALFPIVHLGRPWLAYWMVPYPAESGLWPQFRSPLTWDMWGILSHLVVVGLFWYVGLIPDLGTLRDRARSRGRRYFYGLLALGWRGAQRQWAAQRRAHRLIAISVLPFLFVIQSTVALEFAITLVPGWHETILPLRLLVTGFASGLGVILMVAHLLRAGFGLERHIDEADLNLMARLLLATALISAAVIAVEFITLALGGPFAQALLEGRLAGPDAPVRWTGMLLLLLAPQLLWIRSLRQKTWVGVSVGIAAALGAWCEHYALVVGGIKRDWLVDTDRLYTPTFNEVALLVGSAGLFAALMLLFVRILPVMSIYDLRMEQREQAA